MRRRCCKSLAHRPANCSQCSRPCWRMPLGFEAKFGVLYRYDDAGFAPAALSNAPPAYATFVWSRGQFFPQTGNGLDRLLHTKAVIHTVDEAAEKVPTNSARLASARS